ncbi:hypothetical protein [Candidatus Regiella insecticola]|nr:hypothetical protein [Candidatus Regiella insecticola]
MSVDRLRDSANTRSQQRSGFKGEGYKACLCRFVMIVKCYNRPLSKP